MAADYSRFEWRESEKGVWRRDCDEAELFYHSKFKEWEGTGRTFFYMTDSRQGGRAARQSAREAWIALRYDHPCIASQVLLDPADGNYYKVYRMDSGAWVEKTFNKVLTGETGAEWANEDPAAPLLPTLNILSPASVNDRIVRRDLVFRSPHDIIDGSGDSFNPPSLDDARLLENLSPPLRVAANIPPEPSDDVKARLAALEEKTKAGLWAPLEPLGLPSMSTAKVPGVHKRVEHGLDVTATKHLVQACKANNVTPTMAFHAAIPTVIRDLVDKGNESKLVRKAHPTGVYHSASSDKMAVDLEVPRAGAAITDEHRQKEFKTALDTARGFYTSVRYDKQHIDLVPYIFANGIWPLPTTIAAQPPPVPEQSDTAAVSISSMGVIDSIIESKRGNIEVHDPWVTGEELRNGLGLFLGTYRGSLTVSAAYNDAWHNEAEVRDFLRRVIEIVNLGLFGVKDYKQG